MHGTTILVCFLLSSCCVEILLLFPHRCSVSLVLAAGSPLPYYFTLVFAWLGEVKEGVAPGVVAPPVQAKHESKLLGQEVIQFLVAQLGNGCIYFPGSTCNCCADPIADGCERISACRSDTRASRAFKPCMHTQVY